MNGTVKQQLASTPVQTVVRADCPNCDGEIFVDVIMHDTGERPPVVPVEWMLAVGDQNRVQCPHCRWESTHRELEVHSELDASVQSRALVAFRAASVRYPEKNCGLRMERLLDLADARRKGYE